MPGGGSITITADIVDYYIDSDRKIIFHTIFTHINVNLTWDFSITLVLPIISTHNFTGFLKICQFFVIIKVTNVMH